MPRTKLQVEIDADSAKFNRRMKALGATVAAVGIAIAAVGVASAVAFVRMASDVAKMNDELGKNAKKLQITNDQLQQLNLLAQFSGIGVKGVEGAFRGLGTKVLDLKRNLASAKEEFALLGLDESNFGGNTFDNFKTVLKALTQVEDKQIKLGLANKLMGRQGGAFLAALSDGAEGLDDVFERIAKNRAFFISDKEIKRSESMNDQMAEFSLGLKRIKSLVATQVFPAFERLTKVATQFLRELLENPKSAVFLEKLGETAEKLADFFIKSLANLDMDKFLDDLTRALDKVQELLIRMDKIGAHKTAGFLASQGVAMADQGLDATGGGRLLLSAATGGGSEILIFWKKLIEKVIGIDDKFDAILQENQ